MNLHSIETVRDAIAFLRTIDVEVIGIQQGWIVRGMDENISYVELTCDTDAELIRFTRQEREARLSLACRFGVTSSSGSLVYPSCSSGRLRHQTLLSDWSWQPTSRNTMEVKA